MSFALREWRGTSGEVLDEIELVHGRVEGTSVGRRILTRQVNYAYATLVAAHFQGYCRAVHTEAARALAVTVPDPALASVFAGLLTERRSVDRAIPRPATLVETSIDSGSISGRTSKQLTVAIGSERRSSLSYANGATG
jgi:hypothetical protein